MNNLVLLTVDLFLLAIAVQMPPFKGWWRDFKAEPVLLLFVVPLIAVLGWPRDDVQAAFAESSELGLARIGRIALVLVFAARAPFVLGRTIIPRPLYVMFGYMLFAAITTVFSPQPVQSGWKVFELLVVLLVGCELYGRAVVDPVLHATQFANSLALIAFALCVSAIVGAVLARDRCWAASVFNEDAIALRGVLPALHPNMLGQLGGTVTTIGLLRFAVARQRGDFLVLAVGLACLIMAHARTAIATAPLVALVALVALNRFERVAALILAGMGGLMFALGAIARYFMRGQDTLHVTSLSGRDVAWKAAYASFKENPWFGHGFYVGHQTVWVPERREYLQTVDNTYLETLVDLGVGGGILIVLVAATACLYSWSGLRRSRFHRDHIEPCVITFAFVGFVVVRSLTATSFQVLHFNYVFLVVAFVIFALFAKAAAVTSVAHTPESRFARR